MPCSPNRLAACAEFSPSGALRLLAPLAFAVALLAAPSFVLAHGEVHELLEALNRQIAQSPGDAQLYLGRAALHRLHQDWVSALTDLDRAAALDSELFKVDLARGEMLLQAGRPAQAMEALNRYVSRTPTDFAGYAARARVAEKQLEYAAAAADFARALERLREPDPALILERVHALLRAARTGEALQCLDAGIAQLGPLVTLQGPAIDLEASAGRVDSALARIDVLLAGTPRKEHWLTRKGEILAEHGRVSEARRLFVAAQVALESLPVERRTTASSTQLALRIQSALNELDRREISETK